MNQNGPEQIKTYLIPNNFIDESRVFNGALRTRFVIEAIIVFLLVFIPCWVFIPSTVDAKIGITFFCSLPLAIAALAGINDDSLFTFIKNVKGWRKSKQVMLYNDDAQIYKARPVDVMMSEVYASDFVMTAYSDWKSKRAAKNADVELIEGVDFEFRDDTEYQIMTPKNLRDTRNSEKARQKLKREEEKARALQAKIDKKNAKKQAKLEAKRRGKKMTAQAEPLDTKSESSEALIFDTENEELSFPDSNANVQQFVVSFEESSPEDEMIQEEQADESAAIETLESQSVAVEEHEPESDVVQNASSASAKQPQSHSRSRSRRRRHGSKTTKQTTSVDES